mmetsp:Transcript_21685/g.60569  ORF Transcript_21685/g.60569 Transcript_21685/m.60569 type:complete len:267 (-) Transcript_21685:981-1781(-)
MWRRGRAGLEAAEAQLVCNGQWPQRRAANGADLEWARRGLLRGAGASGRRARAPAHLRRGPPKGTSQQPRHSALWVRRRQPRPRGTSLAVTWAASGALTAPEARSFPPPSRRPPPLCRPRRRWRREGHWARAGMPRTLAGSRLHKAKRSSRPRRPSSARGRRRRPMATKHRHPSSATPRATQWRPSASSAPLAAPRLRPSGMSLGRESPACTSRPWPASRAGPRGSSCAASSTAAGRRGTISFLGRPEALTGRVIRSRCRRRHSSR